MKKLNFKIGNWTKLEKTTVGIKEDFYITATTGEKKLLTQYRKLTPRSKEKCLKEVQGMTQNAKPGFLKGKRVSRRDQKAKNTQKLKKMAKTIRKITLKG